MNKYLVIGIYQDNMQRFAMQVKAESPWAAQIKLAKKCRKKHCDILIAGVVGSDVRLQDEETNAYWPSMSNIEHTG